MRPSYDELLNGAAGTRVPGSSWGLWSDGDPEVGTLNDVSADNVVAAARLVERGAVFSLNWSLELPSPALFSRGPIEHVLRDDGFGMDDHFNKFYPQSSSQWDALNHFAHPEHGFYGGRTSDKLKGPQAENSIANLARRGIAGRFVLADVARWRAAQGRPIDYEGGEVIPVAEVAATLAAQGAAVQLGDILLLRFGWTAWYEGLEQAARDALAALPDWDFKSAGLEHGEEAVRWLWDSGAVAVVADNPSVEAFPFDPRGPNLHSSLIALLGIPLGEMWQLDGLAADCAADGRSTGLLVAAPLNMPGSVGSTANALALK